MKNKVFISIITCCKNSMPYLINNIKSINKQNFKNYEHIFIASKSNDKTIPYLKNLKKKIYFSNSNNIYKAINLGIKKSKGEIIFLLHSDDEVIDKKLFKNIEKNFFNENIDFIYGNCFIVKRSFPNQITRKWMSKKIINKSNIAYNLPAHTTFFIRRKVFKELLYNTKFKISSDYEFLINLFYKFKGKYINKFFIKMRTGGISSSYSKFFIKMKEDLLILKKFYNSNYLLIYLLKLVNKIKQKLFFI
jgi:glycosyltransferase